MKRMLEPSGEYQGLCPPRPSVAARLVWRPRPSGRIASIVPSGVLKVIQRLSGDQVGCSTYVLQGVSCRTRPPSASTMNTAAASWGGGPKAIQRPFGGDLGPTADPGGGK